MVGLINNAGVPLICCGEKMQELIPNTVDASAEKHVPVIKLDGNKVIIEIGSAPHPMTKSIILLGYIFKQKRVVKKRTSFQIKSLLLNLH